MNVLPLRFKRMARPGSVALRSAFCLSLVSGSVQATPDSSVPPSTAKTEAALNQSSEGQAANAEEPKTSKEWMRVGAEHYRRGDLPAARTALLRAWELEQHTAIAASLAEIEMRLNHYAEALTFWEFYIGRLPPDRSEAEAHAAECRRHLAGAHVVVTEPGVTLSVNGKEIGQSPIATDLWLDPGEHEFALTLPGAPPSKQTIALKQGEVSEVSLTAPRRPMQIPSRPVEPSSDSSVAHGTARKVTLISGGVLTAVAVGLGVAFKLQRDSQMHKAEGLLASVNSESEPRFVAQNRACRPDAGYAIPSDCEALSDIVDKATFSKWASIASFASAGVLGAATVATYFVWKPSEKSAATQGRLVVTPWVSPSSQGARLDLTF